MKYLCLVYLDEKRLHELPDEDCVEFDTSIRKSGHCIASEALQSVQTATTVRVRSGKMSITDGPFAETKEQLAGFYMIEARDLNEAILVWDTGTVPNGTYVLKVVASDAPSNASGTALTGDLVSSAFDIQHATFPSCPGG